MTAPGKPTRWVFRRNRLEGGAGFGCELYESNRMGDSLLPRITIPTLSATLESGGFVDKYVRSPEDPSVRYPWHGYNEDGPPFHEIHECRSYGTVHTKNLPFAGWRSTEPTEEDPFIGIRFRGARSPGELYPFGQLTLGVLVVQEHFRQVTQWVDAFVNDSTCKQFVAYPEHDRYSVLYDVPWSELRFKDEIEAERIEGGAYHGLWDVTRKDKHLGQASTISASAYANSFQYSQPLLFAGSPALHRSYLAEDAGTLQVGWLAFYPYETIAQRDAIEANLNEPGYGPGYY